VVENSESEACEEYVDCQVAEEWGAEERSEVAEEVAEWGV
jgi:hypothetical protein